MVKKLLGALIAAIAVLAFASSANAQQVLKNAYLTTSNALFSQDDVTHTFTFYHPGNNLGSVRFTYCTTASGTCSATGLTVDEATEATVTESGGDDATNWAVDTQIVANSIETNRDSGADTDANNVWSFGFGSVDVPDDSSVQCTASGNASTETCYVRVTTYGSTDYAGVSGTTTLSLTITKAVVVTATVDPSFSLIISGVQQGQTATANGTTLTANLTPTVTTLPFRNLTPGTEKFLAQSATVTTNAFGGYTITARMNNNMTGTAYGDDIDGFAGASGTATTTSAESWALPTGTASGTNTGWLGVGTDDTDVSGQGGAASNKFFTLGTGVTTLATQSTSAQSELDIFVFGIEVNSYQRADSYSGTLRYNALPVY